MDLYSVLGLEQEPFSTTADPAFMYASKEHREALPEQITCYYRYLRAIGATIQQL